MESIACSGALLGAMFTKLFWLYPCDEGKVATGGVNPGALFEGALDLLMVITAVMLYYEELQLALSMSTELHVKSNSK